MAALCSRHVGQCQPGFQSFEFWICEIKDSALVEGKSLKTSARKKWIHANLTTECRETWPSNGLYPTGNGARGISLTCQLDRKAVYDVVDYIIPIIFFNSFREFQRCLQRCCLVSTMYSVSFEANFFTSLFSCHIVSELYYFHCDSWNKHDMKINLNFNLHSRSYTSERF